LIGLGFVSVFGAIGFLITCGFIGAFFGATILVPIDCFFATSFLITSLTIFDSIELSFIQLLNLLPILLIIFHDTLYSFNKLTNVCGLVTKYKAKALSMDVHHDVTHVNHAHNIVQAA